MTQITIGFSIHRPEIIPLTADLMRQHEVIFLEEPPASGFRRMLCGAMSIDDYLLPIDVEYPEFSRRMCRLLRRLYHQGREIIQAEPFLEHLLAIHLFFSEGHGPSELKPGSVRHQVYMAERDATGALLDYYTVAMNGSFEAVLGAVIRFARLDADRFRLRDALRVRALADQLKNRKSAYIEAGAIHWSLRHRLRKHLPEPAHVEPVFIAHEALHHMGEKGHLFGPGDQLTLIYIFHPNIKKNRTERLLAARSLIYTKLIEKEEFSADVDTFPHIRNELSCIRTVKQLEVKDCGRLFPLIRRMKTPDARRLVADYLDQVKHVPHPQIDHR